MPKSKRFVNIEEIHSALTTAAIRLESLDDEQLEAVLEEGNPLAESQLDVTHAALYDGMLTAIRAEQAQRALWANKDGTWMPSGCPLSSTKGIGSFPCPVVSISKQTSRPFPMAQSYFPYGR